jgi:hypothetical protein
MPDLGARLDAALDQYRIERKVGEGGMAVVFLAEDLKHNRQVALKVMKPDVGTSLGSERFLREIDIAAKLSHPHVLPLYDSGEVEGLHYIVMPYVEGESLRDSLLRKRPKRFRGDVAYALEGIPQTELRPPDALENRQSPCVRAVRHRPVIGEEYDASSTFRTCEVDLLEQGAVLHLPLRIAGDELRFELELDDGDRFVHFGELHSQIFSEQPASATIVIKKTIKVRYMATCFTLLILQRPRILVVTLAHLL